MGIRAVAASSALCSALAIPAGAAAQSLYAGGGRAFPTGDFKTESAAESGWFALAGLLFGLADGPVSVGAEVSYGTNGHEGAGADGTDILSAMGVVEISFGDGGINPYLFGGAGVVNRDDEGGGGISETRFGAMGAAGLGVPFGSSVGGWLEGRYAAVSGTRFFALLAGLYLQLGG